MSEIPETDETTMVEHVARAVWPMSAHSRNGIQPDDDIGGTPAWRMYEPFARRAIEAMRDPTKPMIVAAMPLHLDKEGGAYTGLECWRAMIDAALK